MSSPSGKAPAAEIFLCGLFSGVAPSSTLTRHTARHVISTEGQVQGRQLTLESSGRGEASLRGPVEALALWPSDERPSGLNAQPLPQQAPCASGCSTQPSPPAHAFPGVDEAGALVRAEQVLRPGLAAPEASPHPVPTPLLSRETPHSGLLGLFEVPELPGVGRKWGWAENTPAGCTAPTLPPALSFAPQCSWGLRIHCSPTAL